VGKYLIESLARLPVEVDYASEFRYRRAMKMPNTLTIVISQSGETADTLEALRAAKRAGSRVVGLVNVVGSTIAREADGGVFLRAGPEVGVASTKAFTAQLVALLLVALFLGRRRGLSGDDGRQIVGQLTALSDLVSRALDLDDAMADVAGEFSQSSSALFLGRGLNFPVALEGALKLKEISYIHAEGYPAAEMKHGPIALIDTDLPVVFIAPKDRVYPKVVSNMQEVRARGGRIVAITSEGNGDLRHVAAHQVRIPACAPFVAPIVASIPLQLLAYHTAVQRGCDVDRPRNLAKSVTVE
jgi:glucosamine--fructose-6-phosphate aminotransferase (isomerizing)